MSKLNRKRPLPLHESGPFAGVLESKHCRALPLSELELKEEKPIEMSALSTPRAAMTTPTGLRRIQKLPQRLPEPPEKPQFRCRYHIGECVDKVGPSSHAFTYDLQTHDASRSGLAVTSLRNRIPAAVLTSISRSSRNYMSSPRCTNATPLRRLSRSTGPTSARLSPSTARWAQPCLAIPS